MDYKQSRHPITAKASVAQQKQLELLLHRKVAACIAQEKEAQRASEASEGVMPSGIAGYRKGKVPEKCICTNCLRKGIKCKWDEGGQGNSEKLFFFFDFNLKHR